VTRKDTLTFRLHPKQLVAFRSKATEILYRGAAGGGKPHLMRAAAISGCSVIAGLQVLSLSPRFGGHRRRDQFKPPAIGDVIRDDVVVGNTAVNQSVGIPNADPG
jgi:hypothetical protein